MRSTLQISRASLFLCVFFMIAQFFNGFQAARTSSFAVSNPWYSLAIYWAFGWWFINDSRKQGIQWVDDYLDLGMLLYLAWPFLVPYYLFRSRGWKAVFTIGLFLGVFFGAYFLGAILYFFTTQF